VLYFLQKLHNNRWSVVPDVDIQQTKLDLLQIELVKPIQRYSVAETNTAPHPSLVFAVERGMSSLGLIRLWYPYIDWLLVINKRYL